MRLLLRKLQRDKGRGCWPCGAGCLQVALWVPSRTPPGEVATTPRALPGRCIDSREGRASCPQRGYSRSLKENSAASYFFWNGPWLQNENAPCAGQHQLPKSQSHSRDLRTAMSPGRGSSAKLATPSPALSWATGPPGPGNVARPGHGHPASGWTSGGTTGAVPSSRPAGTRARGPACCAPGEGLSVNGRKFP